MIVRILALIVTLTLAAAARVPRYEPDPFWPKPLPNKWMLGQVGGTFVDRKDHLWITTRPRSLDDNDKYASFNPPRADCCAPPPPIIEFDPAGNVVQAWG